MPTSNICERLVSTVGYKMTDCRNRLNPVNLESQIFLHANCDLLTLTNSSRLTSDVSTFLPGQIFVFFDSVTLILQDTFFRITEVIVPIGKEFHGLTGEKMKMFG